MDEVYRHASQSAELVSVLVQEERRNSVRLLLHRLGALLRRGECVQTGRIDLQSGHPGEGPTDGGAARGAEQVPTVDRPADVVQRRLVEETVS